MYLPINKKQKFLVSLTTFRQFIFFSTVGGSGLVLDIAILFALIEIAGLNAELAKIFSTTCVIVYTWILNRTITFADGDTALVRQLIKYFKYMLFGMFVNYSVFYFMNLKLSWLDYGYTIAAALGSLCAMVFNFLSMKYRVFRGRSLN